MLLSYNLIHETCEGKLVFYYSTSSYYAWWNIKIQLRQQFQTMTSMSLNAHKSRNWEYGKSLLPQQVLGWTSLPRSQTCPCNLQGSQNQLLQIFSLVDKEKNNVLEIHAKKTKHDITRSMCSSGKAYFVETLGWFRGFPNITSEATKNRNYEITYFKLIRVNIHTDYSRCPTKSCSFCDLQHIITSMIFT